MANKPILPKNRAAPLPQKGRSKLALLILGGALALIVFGVLILVRQAPDTGAPGRQPELAVDREQLDFGKVPLDKPVRAEFQLTNVGDAPLQIAGVPIVEVREGC